MTQPIKPQDIANGKLNSFPDGVIKVWNGLIAGAFTEGRARVLQKDAVAAIAGETGYSPADVFTKGWLNIEEIFREAGWTVYYDKPAYNESYDAYFVFSVG